MPVSVGEGSGHSSSDRESEPEPKRKAVVLPVEDPSEYRPEFQDKVPSHLGKKKDDFRVYTEV